MSASRKLRRRKCIIASALVVEIVLFSIVTFVIAYVSSLNAIHHASQQLADSMVDTVSVRVVGYFESTEASVRQAALVNRYASLPEDYTGPASWYTEWELQMRSLMMTANYDVSAFAMLFDDVSMVSSVMHEEDGVFHVTFDVIHDAREMRHLRYRKVNLTARNVTTQAELSSSWVLSHRFPGPRDYRMTYSSTFYSLQTHFGRSEPWCVWTPLSLDSGSVVAYNMCVSCSVINATGTFLGTTTVIRRITTLNQFLQDASITPNTDIFILDGEAYLVAATTDEAAFAALPANDSTALAALPPGCISSTTYNNATVAMIGCRPSASTSTYAPLRSLAQAAAHYLTTSTRVNAYLSLAGSMYFIVCMPVAANRLTSSSMTLILFLPEADVLRSVQDGLVTAVVVCVVLCVIGAMLSSFLVVTVIGPPLRVKSTSRRSASRLNDDDDVVPPLHQFAPIFNAVVTCCRSYDRVSGGNLRNARLVTVSDLSATDALGVNLVFELTLRSTSDEASDDGWKPLVDSIVAQHGGDAVLSRVSTRAYVAHWRPQDEAEVRAILCGLGLMRVGVVTRSTVSRVATRWPAADAQLGTDAAQDLSRVADGCVLVQKDVLTPQTSAFFVLNALPDGCAEVSAVAVDASLHVARRVRFVVEPALPLRTLLAAS